MTTKPLFLERQWHLKELNVIYGWRKGITGKNITVCVVDDGVYYNPDLEIKDTKFNPIIKNFNLLLRKESYLHGTSVAGIIGAKGNEYVVGIAYDCTLIAYNLTGNPMVKHKYPLAIYILKYNNKIDIFNNSWGPIITNNPNDITPYHFDILRAIEISSMEGRKKKGNIFVFASGNDALRGGLAAYNLLINNRFIIAVGAAKSNLDKSTYSNNGINILCIAPAGNDRTLLEIIQDIPITASYDQFGITTTLPYTKDFYKKGFIPYTHDFDGTSAACPMVSGCIALLLSYRPDLTWRDVKELISRSCYQDYFVNNIVHNSDFIFNGRKQIISQKTGYGMINLKRLIKNAKKWNLLPKEKYTRREQHFDLILNRDNKQITINFDIKDKFFIETVQVYLTVNSNPPILNQLIFNTFVTLISPQETKLPLINISFIDPDFLIREKQYYNNEPFLCELLRGEISSGIWTIQFDWIPIEEILDAQFCLKHIKLDIYGH